MEKIKSVEDKIVKAVVGFYDDYLGDYVSAYLSWLSDLLSGTEPFAVLAISICLLFAMMIYLWYRSRNA